MDSNKENIDRSAESLNDDLNKLTNLAFLEVQRLGISSAGVQSVPNILAKACQAVESLSRLKSFDGNFKKQAALNVLHKVLQSCGETAEDTAVIDTIASTIVDALVSVSRGEYKLQNQASMWSCGLLLCKSISTH